MKSRGTRVTWKGIDFHSTFERDFAEKLDKLGIRWEYEADHIPWTSKVLYYTPDFKVWVPGTDKFFYIETKGYLASPDRTKMLRVKEQHPELDIRFSFMRPKIKLNSKAKSRPMIQEQWAKRYGFPASGPDPLPEWFNLPPKDLKKDGKSSSQSCNRDGKTSDQCQDKTPSEVQKPPSSNFVGDGGVGGNGTSRKRRKRKARKKRSPGFDNSVC